MCAARGDPQGDVCHPANATSPRRPPPDMQSPASSRSLAEDGGGSPCSHLTQPSPRSPRSRPLPSCLVRLGRSPKAEKPDRVWTVRNEAGAGHPGPNDIIITDICLNHKPELSLNTSAVLSRPTSPGPHQLSASDLQRQALERRPISSRPQVSPVSHPSQTAQQGGCSLLGSARALLARLATLFRSGADCGPSQDETEAGSEERTGRQEEQPREVPPPTAQHDRLQRLPVTGAPGRVVTPELVVTPDRDGRGSRAESWAVIGELVHLQPNPTTSSNDPVYRKPAQRSLLKPPKEGRPGLRAVHSLLDIQREKERAEMHPARYLDDLRVLYNIHRRELVSQLVYRKHGLIFQREGAVGEPPHLRRVIGSLATDVIKPDPHSHSQEARERLIKKIASLRPMVSPHRENPEPCWGESEFVQSCLRAHNLYRARHSAPPLTLSDKLCGMAQAWVNHLAHTGTLRHRGQPGLGENLFCRNTALILRGRTSIMPDITGEEVAAYWYSSVRQYRFNRPPGVLQAAQGPFTQMVWEGSTEFGVGKARSRSGKIIVVAHYSPAGNIENSFKENVHPLNTRALAAEILGQVPGETTIDGRVVEGPAVERVLGVLAAQPPRLTGRNATKVIAAHLLGHTASLVTTQDEQIEVVINRHVNNPMKDKCKRLSLLSGATSTGVVQDSSVIPGVSCCPTRFRLRARASVSPADVQSSVIHEGSPETSQGGEDAMSPLRHWLQSQCSPRARGAEMDNKPTEVIELKRGDLGTPSSGVENLNSLNVSASPRNTSLRPKRARLRKPGLRESDSETSDLEMIRSESFDSVDSQSHPEPGHSARRTDSGVKEDVEVQSCDGAVDPKTNKINLGLKLPYDVPDAEHGRFNYYALSPVRY